MHASVFSMCSAEEEGKKVMMAQFQAQEMKIAKGLKDVQASSVQERTLLHKQLQDANAKLALAAEVCMCVRVLQFFCVLTCMHLVLIFACVSVSDKRRIRESIARTVG